MITSLLLALPLVLPLALPLAPGPAPAPARPLAPTPAAAPTGARVAPSPWIVAGDSADVAATVTRFHQALAAGDGAAALALLQPHVVILESGGVERLADYRAHHLPADIEFARAVPSERGVTTVQVRGDVAWASGTSVTKGEFRGRAINSSGAELMVLERTPQGWRIAAIHWSSRARRS